MKKYASLAAGLLLLIVGSAAQAEDAKPFVTNKDVDLTMILPPPPANDSAETKAELGEVLKLQVTRCVHQWPTPDCAEPRPRARLRGLRN